MLHFIPLFATGLVLSRFDEFPLLVSFKSLPMQLNPGILEFRLDRLDAGAGPAVHDLVHRALQKGRPPLLHADCRQGRSLGSRHRRHEQGR